MFRDDLELSIQGNTFAAMKEDFDSMLENLMNSMEEKGAEEATLTLKLGIALKPAVIPVYGGEREAVLPVFKHDISSVMTVKNKTSGSVGAGMELVYDKVTGTYVLRRIMDGQMWFEEDGSIINNDADEEEDGYEYEEPEE